MNHFLRDKDLASMLSVSRSTVWRWAKENPLFPKPKKLSTGVTVWNLQEVDNWINQKEVRNQDM